MQPAVVNRYKYLNHVLSVTLTVGGKGKTKTTDMEEMVSLMKLVLYCVDKVARFSLSKEVCI